MSGWDGEGQKYSLTSDEADAAFWGFAQEADGLFTPLQGEAGARRVHLTGCLPQGSLLKCSDHIGSRRAVAGNAWMDLLDAGGASMGSYFLNEVTVVGSRPSAQAVGLVDLTVTMWCDQALPGADYVWDLLRAGRLQRTGMWSELGPTDRRAWLSVALLSREYQRGGRPDAPAHQSFTLDGEQIVDLDSFFCAIGEALNGAGGYFGWNLDALVDCLRGRWGATPPFTLHWQQSEKARARLVERRDVGQGVGTLFELLLEIFDEEDVRVVLE